MVKTMWNQVFTEPIPADLLRLATFAPSTGAGEDYAWLGDIPQFRKWVGDRVFKDIRAYKYRIENEEWEDSIAVPRKDVEDDQLGLIGPKVKMLAEAYRKLQAKLLADLLNNGFAANCYDGQYFFDDDHPKYNEAAGTWNNLGVAVLDATGFKAGRLAMESLVSDQDSPLDTTPDLLVVPPALRATAEEMILKATLSGGETNSLYKAVDIMVLPRLTSATAWFLLDTKHAVKALMFQERIKPELTALDKPDDANVFLQNRFLYGGRARCNAGYGLPFLAYGSTGAGA
jgi:phage major head subunit gpT-like protein